MLTKFVYSFPWAIIPHWWSLYVRRKRFVSMWFPVVSSPFQAQIGGSRNSILTQCINKNKCILILVASTMISVWTLVLGWSLYGILQLGLFFCEKEFYMSSGLRSFVKKKTWDSSTISPNSELKKSDSTAQTITKAYFPSSFRLGCIQHQSRTLTIQYIIQWFLSTISDMTIFWATVKTLLNKVDNVKFPQKVIQSFIGFYRLFPAWRLLFRDRSTTIKLNV